MQSRKLAGDRVHKPTVGQMPCGGEDHVACMEAAEVIVQQPLLVETRHSGCGAQDRFAERMIFPEVLREQLVDKDVRVILVNLDLFKNHAAFALNVARSERSEEHTSELQS